MDRGVNPRLDPPGIASEKAAERLIQEYMPAILGCARSYIRLPMVGREELIQSGVTGLLEASRRYHRSRGPFWPYASWWVRQAMQRLVAELSGPVVLSDRAARDLARVKRARTAFQQRECRDPTVRELGEATGMPQAKVGRLLASGSTWWHPGESAGEEDPGPSPVNSLPDPRAEEDMERVLEQVGVELGPMFSELDARERHVLAARFGLVGPTESRREIANKLDVSVERVRQIQENALKKLRTLCPAVAA